MANKYLPDETKMFQQSSWASVPYNDIKHLLGGKDSSANINFIMVIIIPI